METIAKPLEQLQRGDGVYYNHTEWYVVDREIYKESDAYQEIQWTLHNKEADVRYLVRSEEKKGQDTEYIWVITKAIDIESVEYEPSPGKPTYFQEDEFVKEPPQTIKFDGVTFEFEGRTTGKAKDDDGNLVTKLTWDYYDESKKRNLAIEIWKESDRDYPEAYDGIVVDPSEFQVVYHEAVGKISGGSSDLLTFWKAYGWISATVFFIGIPFDCYLLISVPVFLAIVMLQMYSWPWRLAALGTWIVLGSIFFLTGGKASFWIIASCCVIAATVIPRLIIASFPKEDSGAYSSLAFTGLLPPLWVYSSVMYFYFAPRPHTPGLVLITCELPLFVAAVCYGLNYLLEQNVRS